MEMPSSDTLQGNTHKQKIETNKMHFLNQKTKDKWKKQILTDILKSNEEQYPNWDITEIRTQKL